ncbi:MAG: hypothetical protein CFE34_17665 [Rhodobacteraceae bacterium PARR1]|nr:MAG: hypothetical protein CFE34_17665 [Rhodobacteraceae bacterium PARR1]
MDDKRLTALLTGTTDLSKASLATRILVSRLRIEVRAKPENLPEKLTELKSFIAKNAFAGIDLANA